MTKEKVTIGLFILMSFSLAFSQDNYNSVLTGSLGFGDIKLSSTLDEVIGVFGQPINNRTYTYKDGEGSDGFEEQYYLTYEKLDITFLKYYGETRFSSCLIKTRSIPVKIGKDTILVGDVGEKLKKLYPLSYSEFSRTKKESIFIFIKNSEGFVNIKVENDLVISIAIILDPA